MELTVGGWQLPERFRDTYRLVFADPQFHGLQVHIRRISYEALETNAEVATIDVEAAKAGQLASADLAKLRAAMRQLDDALVSWNLQDADGVPVPCTGEALRGQDLEFVLHLIDAWVYAVSQVQAPVRPAPVPEVDLPMQPD